MPSFVKIGPPGREKNIFEGFLPYMGMAAILVITWNINTNFGSPFPRRLHIKFALIGQAVSDEKIFEKGGRWTTTTNGRRLDGYTISSPSEPNGSGELNIRRAL